MTTGELVIALLEAEGIDERNLMSFEVLLADFEVNTEIKSLSYKRDSDSKCDDDTVIIVFANSGDKTLRQ